MSSSSGADVGSAPASQPGSAPPVGTAPVRRSQALGIVALVLAVLVMPVLALGPMVMGLLGFNLPAYDMVGSLFIVTIILVLGAIGLGIAAMVTRRGWSTGLAAVIIGGIFLLWVGATFFVPMLFRAGY